jgi:hypothetical protein
MVIVAKSEREMKCFQNLGKYVRKKKLEVNDEKTKMIVLNNRKKKNEENEWKWARKQDRKCERV